MYSTRSFVAVLAMAGLLLLVAAPPPAAAAAQVLLVRYGWAPIFCFAGDSGDAVAVPREFCGFKKPAISRFTAWRALRIYPADPNAAKDPKDCPGPRYIPKALDPALAATLSCISPSYTIGNQQAWNEYIWKASGTCTYNAIKYDQNKYFQLIADMFEKYNPDVVLNAAGIRPGKMLDTVKMLQALEKAWGKKAFFRCDRGTLSKISNLYICITAKAPHKIVDCPAKYLTAKGCPRMLEYPTANSVPVSARCRSYYPAF